MKESARYVKIVEWSHEDQCYVGSCPGLFLGGCHGDDEQAVFEPETQRRFANARGWRFRLASHGGGAYTRDESVMPGHDNAPGAVVYEKRDGKLFRKNAVVFGPGDRFCPAWNFLALAGRGADDWTPQFAYWRRPDTLDDGGRNLLE